MTAEEYKAQKKQLEKEYQQAINDVNDEYELRRKDLFEEATNLKIGDVIEVELESYHVQNDAKVKVEDRRVLVVLQVGKDQADTRCSFKCIPLGGARVLTYLWEELEDIQHLGHINLSDKMIDQLLTSR